MLKVASVVSKPLFDVSLPKLSASFLHGLEHDHACVVGVRVRVRAAPSTPALTRTHTPLTSAVTILVAILVDVDTSATVCCAVL